MATTTPHLGLRKPAQEDYYDVETDQNENWEKIDTAIKDNETAITNLAARVTQNEDDITQLKEDVTDNTESITDNAAEIQAINDRIDELHPRSASALGEGYLGEFYLG